MTVNQMHPGLRIVEYVALVIFGLAVVQRNAVDGDPVDPAILADLPRQIDMLASIVADYEAQRKP